MTSDTLYAIWRPARGYFHDWDSVRGSEVYTDSIENAALWANLETAHHFALRYGAAVVDVERRELLTLSQRGMK